MFPTPSATSYGRNKGGANPEGHERPSLETMARRNQWPTPDARCYRSGKGRKPNGHTPQLEAVVGGLLNPTWVEWLMEFPTEWTGSGPSETEWSHWQRQSRSMFSRLTKED